MCLFHRCLAFMKSMDPQELRVDDGLDHQSWCHPHYCNWKRHLKILRTIATEENMLFPRLQSFGSKTSFLAFSPKSELTEETADRAVRRMDGDIFEMLMQMLEVSFTFHVLPLSPKVKFKGSYIYSWLEYCPSCEYFTISWSLSQNFQIHLRCFQDAFRVNFVVRWESLTTVKISFTRPRVYLIDFDAVMQFPAECPETECVSMGLPLGSSFSTELGRYTRPHAPVNEFAFGIAYSPFIWQLGISFSDIKARRYLLFLILLNASLDCQSTFSQSTRSWWIWLILTPYIVWMQRRHRID